MRPILDGKRMQFVYFHSRNILSEGKSSVPGFFFCLFLCFFVCLLAHVINLVVLFFRLTSTGAILDVFRRLPQGVAVTVDNGEQHGPRRAAPTVEFSQRTPTQEGLESRDGAHLLAGRLVRQTPFCCSGSGRAFGPSELTAAEANESKQAGRQTSDTFREA